MRLAWLPMLSLLACSVPDTDGDGLDDRRERELGTSETQVDTDGDGLTDGEEYWEIGTDPLLVDTDGDTYLDPWELEAGTDPRDYQSRIYTDFWPYNPGKEGLRYRDFSYEADVGDPIGRVIGVDRHGDEVELADFTGQGKPIVVNICAPWCPPCQNVASWLVGGDDPYNLESQFARVREAVGDGDIYWVELITDDDSGGPATQQTVASWATAYPHAEVPMLAVDGELMSQLRQSGLPNIHALDEDYRLIYRNDNQSYTLDFGALDAAMALIED